MPEGTKTLALIVDDPDAPDPKAPKRTWVHWVLYDIPTSATGLAEGVGGTDLPAGTLEGLNDWKKPGYGGPCPPVGRHRYFFKLYALDDVLTHLEQPTKQALEKAMIGHVLGQAEIIGTYLGALELRNDASAWVWSVRAYGRWHDDRFQLFREGDGHYRYRNGFFIRGEADTARFTPTFFYTFHNRHRTQVAGAEAQVQRRWKGGTTAIGVHGRSEHILSNVLGRVLDSPIEAAGAREAFTRRDERQNLAVHVDHRWEKGRFELDAGLLLNANTRFMPEWVPGADAVFRWNGRHSTYTSVGRAFRLPTWTDLYYNRGGAQGSLDLLPESATNMELGHRLYGARWKAQVALWRRQGSDLIDWVRLPGETTVRAANLTQVDINGIELSYSMHTNDQRGQGGALYAYQLSDQQDFPFTSLYVLDHLVHNAVVWWQHELGAGFRARVNATWRTRNGQYVRYSDGQLVDYPQPLRIDLRADREYGRVGLFISVSNVLNAEQVDRGNVPLPGRWLCAGMRVKWDRK